MRRLYSEAKTRFSETATLRCTVVAALALGIVGCGSSGPPPGPYNTVSNYLNSIAQGTYGGACNLADSRTREALIKAMGGRVSCARLFVRCLPSDALKLSRDQSQLLYATILVSTHRKKADASVSGTAVARAVGRVTLAKEHGTWVLTSYGTALARCPRKPRRPRR
ncbi:MAG: hypothetical protein JO342_14270 [Solirubrobacterales bacterium]|nr:hypothetical protein [Solirubrobacterales bacterium]MBV9167303.1 hypothetical protein [Solirubrobacterales bacterium]